MRRWLVIGSLALAALGAAGFAGYTYLFRGEGVTSNVQRADDAGDRMPTADEFDALVRADPVKALHWAAVRYQRANHPGLFCTFEKQERLDGDPKHPAEPPGEVMSMWVRGDVPDPQTNKTAVEVAVRVTSNTRADTGVKGLLYSELPPPTGLGGKLVTWQKRVFGSGMTEFKLDPDSPLVRKKARYCICDAGLYHTIVRTHTAWKSRQDAGTLTVEYVGVQKVEKAGGRECHVVRRTCPEPELDAYVLNGKPDTDPKTIAAQGFTEVLIYLDRETWLQVGTEQYRTGPDGARVLVARYYFRDIDLNPTFAPDTFSVGFIKK